MVSCALVCGSVQPAQPGAPMLTRGLCLSAFLGSLALLHADNSLPIPTMASNFSRLPTAIFDADNGDFVNCLEAIANYYLMVGATPQVQVSPL